MTASAASARHETRALLRAHLSAATSYRHLTRHCPICHRLERLALETAPAAQSRPEGGQETGHETGRESSSEGSCEGGCEGGCEPSEDESPPNA